MKEQIRLNQFIAQAMLADGDRSKLIELALKAIMGRETPCLYDGSQNCSICDRHNVHTVNDVIVRVSKEKRQICCVEWPVLQDEPGRLIGRKWIRSQVRHCKDQKMFLGTIFDFGPDLISEADPESTTNLSSLLLKATRNRSE